MFEIPIYVYSLCLFIGAIIVALYLLKSNNGYAKGLILPSLVMLMSGLSILLMYRLDSLVHGNLYNWGLQFNEAWANEYWLLQRSVMGFNTIVVAVGLGMVVKERVYPSRFHKSPELTPSPSPVPSTKSKSKKRRIRAPKLRKSTETTPLKSMEERMEGEGANK